MTIITVISQQATTTEEVNSLTGVPSGGTAGQVLTKVSGTNFDLTWSSIASSATNLSIASKTSTTFDILSSTGTDVTLPAASITEAGLLIATDKVKLNNLGTASYLNVPASGNAASGEVVKGSDTRLSDARTPLTHSHVVSDVTGLQTALDGKQAALNGTGFVKVVGTTVSYDNSTYLTGNQTVTVTGDVSGSGTTAITLNLGSNVVTNAKLAQVATATFKGRVAASTGDVEDLTAAQATSLLDTFTSGAKGLVGASGGGTANFLRADGTWSSPAGGVSDGDKGDITVASSGTVWTVDSAAITPAKLSTGAPSWDTNSVQTLSVAASTPATPAAGKLNNFVSSLAGRAIPSWVTPDNLIKDTQSLFARSKVALIIPTGNGSSVTSLGVPSLSTTGTATTRNVSNSSMLGRVKRVGVVSAASAGSLAAFRVGSNQYTVGDGAGLGGFFKCIRFACSDAATVAGARQFVGMNITASPTDVEPSTLVNCLGVGNGAADTNLKIYYGGSAAQTPIDLGVNFPANTLSADLYELILHSPSNTSNSVTYRVTRLNTGHVAEGTLTGTAGVAIPASTTLLSMHIMWRSNNATALAVALDLITDYIETEI